MRRWMWVLLIGLTFPGCHSAEQPDAAATAALDPESTAAEKAEPATDSPPEATAPTVAEFQPQFPNRTELFAPPQGAQTIIRRDEVGGNTVELKGFVNVDGPQVVLSIDGVLSPIPAGGEKHGVQVISINPPQAVLQRGRNRWTASLE